MINWDSRALIIFNVIYIYLPTLSCISMRNKIIQLPLEEKKAMGEKKLRLNLHFPSRKEHGHS